MACRVKQQDILPAYDLSFDGLISLYTRYFDVLPDPRIGSNTQYKMRDMVVGAFSVFFMQEPSFLAHQRTLESRCNRSNIHTLFQVESLPTDNHIRTSLDPLKPGLLTPIYNEIYEGLDAAGYIDDYLGVNDTLLIPLDATQQLSSQKVHCKNCSTQQHKNGTITYSHKAITPVIVSPNKSRVISLPPEIIFPQDGHDKQDSEHAAAKRWLDAHIARYQAHHRVTILGDDLYAHQPFCELLSEKGAHFILTCKPGSHKTLYEWVNELQAAGHVSEVTRTRKKGKQVLTDTYRFVHQVPLRDGEDALRVNWCSITTTNADGKQVYHSAFVTDHDMTEDNVDLIIKSGRARWHIENGNNNTLKNHGYHLTHNFGHGKENLASFLLSLNILAFLFHTVLELNDKRYQLLRQTLSSRVAFFDSLRTLTTFILFDNWQHLMEFMMHGLNVSLPDTS